MAVECDAHEVPQGVPSLPWPVAGECDVHEVPQGVPSLSWPAAVDCGRGVGPVADPEAPTGDLRLFDGMVFEVGTTMGISMLSNRARAARMQSVRDACI